MDDLLKDIRFALRSAARAPGVFLSAALSIALGVAATTVVFTLVNGLLLQPLPVHAPGELYAIREQRVGRTEQGLEGMRVPYDRFLAYRAATRDAFSALAAQALRPVSLRAGGDARAASADLVSGNYFAVLGIRPELGAFFGAGDEPRVVLGHNAWVARFAGDPGVIGRTVYIDSRPFSIAGVAPPDFTGTFAGSLVDVWVPARAYVGAGATPPWVAPFGRLRTAVPPARAATLVSLVARRIPPDEPQTHVRGALLRPFRPVPVEAESAMFAFLALLFATALLVLLIAAANVAGVLFARGVARRQELSVRLAIGASRPRLVRQLLTESTLLFLVGGAAGVALANAATPLLAAFHPPVGLPINLVFPPDARVLAFSLLLTLLVALAAGLAPALHATRAAPLAGLNESGGRGGSGRARGRSAFVTAQLAMAVLLLVCAGLFTRSLRKTLSTDPGFDARNVVVASINLGPHGYDEAHGRVFYRQLVETVRALPGVESVGVAEVPLSSGSLVCNDVERADAAPADQASAPACYDIVDSDYFRTVRLHLVAGRSLTENDREGAPPVAVINQTMARTLWPGEDPLGKRYRSYGETYTVVGVARDAKYASLTGRRTLFAFYPFAQQYVGRLTLHVRVRGSGAAVLRRIRDEVRTLDPNVALEDAGPLDALVQATLVPQRLASGLIGAFGLVGLLLAALGVYGVLAFHVAQRTRELGIRVALGAGHRQITALVLRRGAVLAAVGAAIGLIGAAALSRVLGSLLVGISPFDAITFTGVPLVLVVVASLASWIPARRAAAIDPMTAIRSE